MDCPLERIVRRNVPERGTADKAGWRLLVPAPARNSHWLLCSPADLRRGPTQRGRAGCLAARESRLAENGLALDHRRTDRLTRELSGGPNAKRLGRPLERIVRPRLPERERHGKARTSPTPTSPGVSLRGATLMRARCLVPAPARNKRTGDPPPLKTACAAAAAVGVRGAKRRRQRGPNSREPQA